MCELFAVSSSDPVEMRYDMREFARHGGQTHSNRDGWGIVYALDRDAYLYKEPAAAATSGLEKYVADHPHGTRLMIAHIRMATAGEPALCNTHPFRRVRGGTACHLAHNGSLPELATAPAYQRFRGEAVGDTDSELALLILLNRLEEAGEKAHARFDIFTHFCGEMRELGDCNFLYTEGERMFVHAHKRRYETEGVWGPPSAPGLHMRSMAPGENGWRARGAAVDGSPARAIMFASVQLDDADWVSLPEGETLLVERGEVLARSNSHAGHNQFS